MVRPMRNHLVPTAILLAAAPVLFAHPGHGESGFEAGTAHPILEADHLLAMVAVGLMAVRCAKRDGGSAHALWQVPATFMGTMLLGGLMALAGVPLPGVEWGIALSVLVFGALVALGTAPRTWVACAVAGLFALLHGHAHVAEMGGVSVASYMGGFLLSTALLHAAGVAGGWWIARAFNQAPVRLAGASLALASAALFVNLLAG